MKTLFFFIFLGCTSESINDELPEEKSPNYGGPNLSVEAYYSPAKQTSGTTLKEVLHEIIDAHRPFPYTSTNTDTWDILRKADRDPVNTANVILIYTRQSVDGVQEYNSGSGWNREHVWAKSRGDFGTSMGVGTDVHNLRASNIQVNDDRSNHSFDYCISGCTSTWNNKHKITDNHGIFEPRDEDKGDVARIIFYMDVRYEGDNGEPDLEMSENTQAWYGKSPYHGVKSTLLAWHKQDPVDEFERNRNDIIYQFQNNRNPFIDYPELADYLWGDKAGLPWEP